MIETIDAQIEQFLQKVIDQAKVRQQEQLVVLTEKLDLPIHPLHFFENGKTLSKYRIFWADDTHRFMIAGIGKVNALTDEKLTDATMDEKWQRLLRRAHIYDPYQTEGTGLLMFGGMDFDSKKEKTALWENFPSFYMVLPQYILVIKGADSFLTTSFFISPDQSTDLVLDKRQERMEQLLHPLDSFPKKATVLKKEEVDPEAWLEDVQGAIDELNAGKLRKIVMARKMKIQLEKEAELSPILAKMLAYHQNSYIFAFQKEQDCFLGATPERLIQQKKELLLSTCLAGTAPRGKTKKEDVRIAKKELLQDEKNLEEHRYVVQMIRKALEHFCTEIDMPNEPIVRTFKDLQHLYTPVTARLKETDRFFELIQTLHPTPALGGYPKERALEFIRHHENLDRGWYGAPIGWMDSNQYGEFAVAIRSGLIRKDQVTLFAGCGVMKDSIPEKEYEETKIKFLPMLSVLEDADETY